MSETPAEAAPRGRPAKRAPRDDTPLLPSTSTDDSDTGWNEDDRGPGDEQYLRDKPPHWS